MNVSQLHEQIRREMLRRIQRGVLSGTLLARQTGLNPAHISNFLHRKRHLSITALDRLLAALTLDIEELLPLVRDQSARPNHEDMQQLSKIPLIPQSVISEAIIRRSSISELIQLPIGFLDHLPPKKSSDRRTWERFVAIRISYAQAEDMMPAIQPHAILVLDRHYTSLVPYRTIKPNIYALRVEMKIVIRYATLQKNHIVLRPASLESPIELLELRPEQPPSNFVIGRACITISEL